jgi:HK97 family phage prohead protease
VKFKSAPTSTKNFDSETGIFEAYISVFDVQDSYGDIVRKGAFAKTLADWETRRGVIPVLWSHRTDDPDMNIGHVLEAKETAHGLWVKAQLDMESPKAATVYRLMKGGRVREFSFAYEVTEGSKQVNQDGEGYYEIRQVNLFEVGPTPIGANPATELLDLKSYADDVAHRIKAGRSLSQANTNLIQSAIESVEEIAETAETIKRYLKNVLPANDPEIADGQEEEAQEAAAGIGPSTASSDSTTVKTSPNPSAHPAFTLIELEALKEAN